MRRWWRLDRRRAAAVEEIVRASPAGVIAWDAEGAITLLNPAAETIFGQRAADVLGRHIAETLLPLLSTGAEPTLGEGLQLTGLRGDGTGFAVGATIIRLAGRAPAAYAAYVRDITDDLRQERAHNLLAGIADQIGSSIDYEATLHEVARLAVPSLADWCGIDMPGPHGQLESVAIAHGDASKLELVRELRRRYPIRADDALAQVATIGGSFLQREVSDEDMVAYARDAEHLRLLRSVGFRSLMVVALTAGRRTIGAMTFVAAESGRRFDDSDLELAEELARRAGTALENARLYRERSELAQTLVASLRPPALPAMRRWRTAALYQPAGRTEEVGGDFYDVISVGDDWMVVIGDVIGKGPAAAARTSLARYSIRTAATLTGSPSAALRHLGEDLEREGQGGLISAACVLLRDAGGQAEAVVAAAGHPLPVLVHKGTTGTIGRPSLLLGVDPAAPINEDAVWLEEGDALVLYTDGVPDTQGREERFGEHRLLDALRGPSDSADALLRRVSVPLEFFQHGLQRDDIAMLVVRRESDEGPASGVVVPFRRQAQGQGYG